MKLDELVSEQRVNELVLALKPHEGRWDYPVYVNGTIRTAVREGAMAALERACLAMCPYCADCKLWQTQAGDWVHGYNEPCLAAPVRALTVED